MSPQRIDYYDSPEAPRANSLVPAVNVVVVNDAGEILLIRRTDNGNWAVPGGAIDLGESVAQAAVRETLEESGIECAITGIVGIYIAVVSAGPVSRGSLPGVGRAVRVAVSMAAFRDRSRDVVLLPATHGGS
jgi:ADP-ribose pyrophosphatase YjhB (NUDIX family)